VAHGCTGFGVSESHSVADIAWASNRLTTRSSRPRVVASAMCFTLRLHMSAAPPQGGLTPALGGRKAFLLTPSVARLSRLRPCCLLVVYRHVPSSVTAWCTLKFYKRCAYRLRKQQSSTDRSSTPDPLLRRRPADSWRGALGSSHFGFRQTRRAFKLTGILRHLTIRSSRPRIVASATCLRYASTRPPPRRGAA
jgi:hypothetical protein